MSLEMPISELQLYKCVQWGAHGQAYVAAITPTHVSGSLLFGAMKCVEWMMAQCYFR